MECVRLLEGADDVTPEILASVEDALEWFDGEPLRVEDFIDRLATTYGVGWDIESYDNPAARKIMRHARRVRRDRA